MKSQKAVTGFIGAGGIARAHAFALDSVKYYYNDSLIPDTEAVCSASLESRTGFAAKYGFRTSCTLDEFLNNDRIDSVFILGPNKVHYEHLALVLDKMHAVKRIYVEKPVCSNNYEAEAMRTLAERNPSIMMQVGFQFLFSSSIRKMIMHWKTGFAGKPLHFDLKYYHSDYLKKEYRDKRATRLTPAPDGGAMADLGSHSISLLIAMLGEKLKITSAMQAGNFDDVRDDSDLFSLISLHDDASEAVGTISASRITPGTGDYFTFELYGYSGALRYSSAEPDRYEWFSAESGSWSTCFTGSDYAPFTAFPSVHVPSGWLRPLIHAHYVFLNGNDGQSFIPGIEHGLAVQKLVNETAEHLSEFRSRNRL